MKVWITKYLFTHGIYETDVVATTISQMVQSVAKVNQYFHGCGKEWHNTKGEALKYAIARLQKKQISLNKVLHSLAEQENEYQTALNDIKEAL